MTQEFANHLQLKEQSLEISVAEIMEEIIQANKFVSVCVKSRFILVTI